MNLKSMMKRRINDVIWRAGLRLSKTDVVEALEACFYRVYSEDFFFVQIGANDGKRYDPIHHLIVRHKLAGLAVEPLVDIFGDLQRTYAEYPRVRLANVAVHRTAHEVELHRVERALQEWDWAHGMASLNPDHHDRVPVDIGPIVTELVPAMSLEALLRAYDVERFDLLQVDTEGYDTEIIRMLLESHFHPSIISFEHAMLEGVTQQKEYVELVDSLMDRGYYVITLRNDAVAYLP